MPWVALRKFSPVRAVLLTRVPLPPNGQTSQHVMALGIGLVPEGSGVSGAGVEADSRTGPRFGPSGSTRGTVWPSQLMSPAEAAGRAEDSIFAFQFLMLDSNPLKITVRFVSPLLLPSCGVKRHCVCQDEHVGLPARPPLRTRSLGLSLNSQEELRGLAGAWETLVSPCRPPNRPAIQNLF